MKHTLTHQSNSLHPKFSAFFFSLFINLITTYIKVLPCGIGEQRMLSFANLTRLGSHNLCCSLSRMGT